MGLNISKGNMYDFVTHTWNTVKGACPHDCTYCYMKRYGKLKPVRFDKKELKTDLGKNNFIFVGSSCDMFATGIPYDWIIKTLEHLKKFDNTYLFQSKSPGDFDAIPIHGPDKYILCTTIETNRVYPEVMKYSPEPFERALKFGLIPLEDKYVTVEPIMDFDSESFFSMLSYIRPIQVNIGADSGSNNLPEPSSAKIRHLIYLLKEITTVKLKPNLKRLYNE